MNPIKSIVILGGGSAGFLTALTLRKRLPSMPIQLVRSPDIGIIGVGEATTADFPHHLHGFLELDLAEFYAEAQPQWKLGIRFLWGRRPSFDYTFRPQIDTQFEALPHNTGFYIEDQGDFARVGFSSALMQGNRVFLRGTDNLPLIENDVAYHIENELLVGYLYRKAIEERIEVLDATVDTVQIDEQGVKGLQLSGGEMVQADLYIDASGFRSRLLGEALEEPFVSFDRSLYNNRAVVGGWSRQDEPIKPYTTAETMQAGWCWQIDHERHINRGYVYSSAFLSDEAAEAEFRAANPRVQQTRIVHFRTGRYERAWVNNVVAIGNASGFVEPLESTGLSQLCGQARALAVSLAQHEGVVTPSLQRQFNRRHAMTWDSIRQFLTIHFRFNDRLDTPYWRECREKADLGGAAEIVAYFQENGPTSCWRTGLLNVWDPFGMEGYLSLLVGQCVPHGAHRDLSDAERATWEEIKIELERISSRAFTVPEALEVIRRPDWVWPDDLYQYHPEGV